MLLGNTFIALQALNNNNNNNIHILIFNIGMFLVIQRTYLSDKYSKTGATNKWTKIMGS